MATGQDQQRARFSLEGRIALVTGGHRGIGRDITLGMAQAGAEVVVLDQKGPGDSNLPQLLSDLGKRYWSFTANFESADEIQTAVLMIKTAVGRIDILVNNAGISRMAPLESLSAADWDATYAVNTRAPFLLAKAFASGPDGMLARGRGAIVNVSSVSGKDGIPLHGAYCASKAGLNLLTKVMAAEWAARGIRANAVAPTVVLTEMGRKVWGGAAGDAVRQKIPQRRFVEAYEVADAVVFLASDAASMVNGEVLAVDGGYGCV